MAETVVLLLENGSNFENRNILGYWFQICKIFSAKKSLKFCLILGNVYSTLREKCPYSELYWSVFSLIRTENGEKSLRFQSEWGKIRTRITPNTNTFHAVKFSSHQFNYGIHQHEFIFNLIYSLTFIFKSPVKNDIAERWSTFFHFSSNFCSSEIFLWFTFVILLFSNLVYFLFFFYLSYFCETMKPRIYFVPAEYFMLH